MGGCSGRARDLDCSGNVTSASWQDDTTLKCWGYNHDRGVLGYGDAVMRGDSGTGAQHDPPGCGGREAGRGWVLTVLPWCRYGAGTSCGRSGGWEDRSLRLLGLILHMRVAGKTRVGGLVSWDPVGLRGIGLWSVGGKGI